MFKKDKVSNGKITYILEKSWLCFKNNKPFRIKLEDLREIHKALLEYKNESVFGEVPENIYINYKDKENNTDDKIIASLIEKAFGIDTNIGDIKMFDSLGFLMHDRIYASAYGRFRYTYRAKGDRIYWFESGNIGVYNIYSVIDESGFQYKCNDMSSINIEECIPNGTLENELLDLGMDYDLNDLHTILSGLLNIRKQYIKDYPLEYLMDPPDVNNLSEFSVMLRNDLWDLVIQLAKKAILPDNEDYVEAFNYMIGIMDKLDIQPLTKHIIDFYDSSFDNINRDTKSFEEVKRVLKLFGEKEDVESFQDSLIYVCQKLQETHIYKNADENDKNCFITKLLTERCKNFVIKDQTLRGESSNGISNGEVDICVENKSGRTYAIIEALVLKYIDKKYIAEHINRVWKYDTSGLAVNYILVYYNGKDFSKFIIQYTDYLWIADLDYKVINIENCEIEYSEIKIVEMKYERSGKKSRIVHICVNMH